MPLPSKFNSLEWTWPFSHILSLCTGSLALRTSRCTESKALEIIAGCAVATAECQSHSYIYFLHLLMVWPIGFHCTEGAIAWWQCDGDTIYINSMSVAMAAICHCYLDSCYFGWNKIFFLFFTEILVSHYRKNLHFYSKSYEASIEQCQRKHRESLTVLLYWSKTMRLAGYHGLLTSRS